MSKKDALLVLAGSYDSVSDAEVDYEAVKALYYNAGIGHDFDAAVLERGTSTARSRSPTSTSSPHVMAPGKVWPSARWPPSCRGSALAWVPLWVQGSEP